ncbi:MAG: hypothetical protein O2890_00410 [Cyanobacteria bacterium]|nr:hypothetical protein [Cyanobacteriota bacterium]
MNQTSSSQAASSVHALADVLPLPLQNTLNSLTVNLEQELTRYRQQKQGIATPPPPVFRPRPRPLSLIEVKAQPNRASSPSAVNGKPLPPPPPPNPKLNRQPPMDGSPVAAAVPAMMVGALATQTVDAPDKPEAYLASSAVLLESLADYPVQPLEPREETHAGTAWKTALGTPLGMGGLLLLLVASAGLGYALVNPAAMHHLATQTPLARFFAADSGETELTESDALQLNSSEQPASLQQPDLSRSEFTELNLSSLSTLPSADRSLRANSSVNASSTPTTAIIPGVAPSPASANTAPTSVAPTPVTLLPRPVPQAASPTQSQRPGNQVRPSNPAATPLPAVPTTPAPNPVAEPATQPAPPRSSPVAASNQIYYVVADYTGDPSLAAARAVVGDAYVHNYPVGARIQLGVYNAEADASAAASALQSQGISATVYTP